VVDAGVTVTGLPDAINVPPHDPVYQLMVAPDTEADRFDEAPAHMADGEAVGDGLAGNGFTVMVIFPQPADQQPEAL